MHLGFSKKGIIEFDCVCFWILFNRVERPERSGRGREKLQPWGGDRKSKYDNHTEITGSIRFLA